LKPFVGIANMLLIGRHREYSHDLFIEMTYYIEVLNNFHNKPLTYIPQDVHIILFVMRFMYSEHNADIICICDANGVVIMVDSPSDLQVSSGGPLVETAALTIKHQWNLKVDLTTKQASKHNAEIQLASFVILGILLSKRTGTGT
jgi:hypothetical protein